MQNFSDNATTALASITTALVTAFVTLRVAGRQQRATILPVELEMIISGWKDELVRLRAVNTIQEEEIETLARKCDEKQIVINKLQEEIESLKKSRNGV